MFLVLAKKRWLNCLLGSLNLLFEVKIGMLGIVTNLFD